MMTLPTLLRLAPRALVPILLSLSGAVLAAEQPRLDLVAEMDAKTVGVFSVRPNEISSPSMLTPFGANSGFYLASPDKKHLAWILNKDDGHSAYLDGKSIGVKYRSIYHRSFYEGGRIMLSPAPVFSPDSEHFLYQAQKTNKKWVGVLDGAEITAECDEILSYSFSPDSRHTHMVVRQGKQALCLSDGKPSCAPYDKNRVGWTVFSSDGRHTASILNKPNSQVAVVVDGKEDALSFDTVQRLTFSNDGARLAYSGQRGKKWHLILDHALLPEEYDRVLDVGFSPGKDRFHYSACVGDQCFCAVDGKPGPRFDAVTLPAFTADGERWGYCGVLNSGPVGSATRAKTTCLVDGKEVWVHALGGRVSAFLPSAFSISRGDRGETGQVARVKAVPGSIMVPQVFGVGFSPGGDRFYCAAKDAVFADGKESPSFGVLVAYPQFGAERKQLSYVAVAKGKTVAVTDSAVTCSIDAEWYSGDIVQGYIRDAHLALDKSGVRRSVAFAVTCDHRVQFQSERARDLSDLLFSPDGRHVALRLEESKDKSFVVLDGNSSPAFDQIVPNSLHFDGQGTLHYYAVKDAKLYRVSHEPGGTASQ